MVHQANHPLPEGYQLQGFRIEGVLSWGGFSIVYRGRDGEGRAVAIKEYLPAPLALRGQGSAMPVVAPEHQRTFRYGLKCFFEEGRALSRLSHLNLVSVQGFFRANDTAYLVMRYEEGRTLHQYLQAHRDGLEEGFLRDSFVRLFNGLREVHACKLLHLDIKPSNIYLCSDGRPMLIDFGAARQTLTDGGLQLSPMFTPGFAPPEQYRGLSLGPWSDMYSVGATLFTCLAGAAPPAADQRLKRDRYVSATRLWRGKYSADLLATIDWCLDLDPLRRPPSVFALQKVLVGVAKPPVLDRSESFFTTVRGKLRGLGGV